MAIQVNTNDQLVENRMRLGRIATIAGLAIIAGGFIASIQNNLLVAHTALLIGFAISNVGAYFLNRWGLGAYKKLEESLKGFDKRYRLYNYLLPVPHLLLTPYGVTVLLVKNQEGKITGTGDSWKQGSSIIRFFRALSAEPLGDPPRELAAQKEKIRGFISEHLPSIAEVPIEGLIVFTNPQAQVSLADVKAPVVVVNKNPDGLKSALRRDKRTPTLPVPIYNQLANLFDETAEERASATPTGWRFWQR